MMKKDPICNLSWVRSKSSIYARDYHISYTGYLSLVNNIDMTFNYTLFFTEAWYEMRTLKFCFEV